MINLENSFKRFEEIHKLKAELPFFFFFKSQELLRLLSFKKKFRSKTNLFKKILIFIINFLFFLISLFNIIKLFFFSKKIAHLFIQINNSSDQYDHRSKHIFEIIHPKKTINLIILNDLKSGLKNVLKIPNAIYILQIKKFLQYFIFQNEVIFLKKQFKKLTSIFTDDFDSYFREAVASKKLHNFLFFVFKFLRVKKIIAIDDPRNINEILHCAKLLNIFTIGYQHARFNRYHVGLMQQSFDKYFVWNSYFKSMAKKLNNKYQDSNLSLTGPIKKINKRKKKLNKIKKIMILDEVFDDRLSQNLIENFLNENKNIFYLRLKPGKNREIILPKKEIKIDNKIFFLSSLLENEIDLVIGNGSTSLLESWLINIPSICIISTNKYAAHLHEDGLLELANNKDKLNSLVEKYLNMDFKNIEEKKKIIWGNNLEYDKEMLSEIILS